MSWEMLGPAAIHPDPNKIRGGMPALTADDVRLALAGLGERPFLFGMAAFLGHRGSMDRIEQMLIWDISDLACANHWGTGKGRDGKPNGELTSTDLARLQTLANLILFEVISARSRHETYAHEQELPSGSAAVLCPACCGRGMVSRIPTDADRDAEELAAGEALANLRAAAQLGEDVKVRNALSAEWHAARRLRYSMTRAVDDECSLCRGRGRFLLTNEKRASMLGVSLRTWERHWIGRYSEALLIPQRWEAIAIGHVRKRLQMTT